MNLICNQILLTFEVMVLCHLSVLVVLMDALARFYLINLYVSGLQVSSLLKYWLRKPEVFVNHHLARIKARISTAAFLMLTCYFLVLKVLF